ncbi:hypothetical protein KIL84_006904 [Mauremys mutica]|uniref:Large ribosomal subunit protein P2 n=2 Tax=Testudinoidea TaxID=8486 RepID=A0A9D4AWH2_9SAUR|nr:hypothetical protein KIL84_006904 [Mauremys mutica]
MRLVSGEEDDWSFREYKKERLVVFVWSGVNAGNVFSCVVGNMVSEQHIYTLATIVLLCNGKCLSTWDMQVTYGSSSRPPSVQRMRYVAAYLLAVLGGNESPASKDLKKILDSVGIETDDERLNKVIGELNGKNIEDVIAQGNGKLASMPVGGAVAVSAGPASAAPAAAPAAAEEKKEEKKEESEESDDDMGFGLFD